jgi:hypothetical protein
MGSQHGEECWHPPRSVVGGHVIQPRRST